MNKKKSNKTKKPIVILENEMNKKKSNKTKKPIVILENEIYDVSKYQHPGDGICNVYLQDYYEKDITEEFEHYHYTDKPFEVIEKAKKNSNQIQS